MPDAGTNAELNRLAEAHEKGIEWKKWGNHLSERQWGTVRDQSGHRPVLGGAQKFQDDPNWRDNILFYEYFHGDNGAGIGTSHQTGWSGLASLFIRFFGQIDSSVCWKPGEAWRLAKRTPKLLYMLRNSYTKAFFSDEL